jgi:DNA-binding transcriptional MerR regulator
MADEDAGARQAPSDLRAIQDVADELGVSSRTIRFYEDKGLIVPQRVGQMRIYTRREVARLRLILRGKRLGFSIREIKDFLDLYDADPQHAEQMRRLIERIDQRAAELHLQSEAIATTIVELDRLRREAEANLAAKTGRA